MLTISIIIPVYKVEAYIEECLASVVTQSDAKANIECIIVDDCSPDGSMDIVRRFVDNYQGTVQFRMLRHEVNRGLSAARNTGIDAATGDYLLFVDSDDYLSADCLSTLVSGFNLCPQAEVVQANNLSGIGGGKIVVVSYLSSLCVDWWTSMCGGNIVRSHSHHGMEQTRQPPVRLVS